MQEAGLIVVILLLGLLLTTLSEPIGDPGHKVNNFLRLGNIVPNVLTPMSWMTIMALGVTFVIISGGIDISVGSVFGLAAMCAAWAVQSFPPNASAWVVLPVGIGVPLLVGLACGLANGLLVVGLRMHPFIVTLATLGIFRCMASVLPPYHSLPFGETDEGLPKVLPAAFTDRFMMRPSWRLLNADHRTFLNLEPWPMVVMFGCLLLAWFALRFTVWGRQIYAVGGNEEAAQFSGLPVNWVKVRVYAISGLCAGIAGMVSASYYGAAASDTGTSYELMVIAAAVVGGASLSGGRGTALGAALGMLIIQVINNGISVLHDVRLHMFGRVIALHVESEYTKGVVGASILIAVAIDQFSARLRSRKGLPQRTGGPPGRPELAPPGPQPPAPGEGPRTSLSPIGGNG